MPEGTHTGFVLLYPQPLLYSAPGIPHPCPSRHCTLLLHRCQKAQTYWLCYPVPSVAAIWGYWKPTLLHRQALEPLLSCKHQKVQACWLCFLTDIVNLLLSTETCCHMCKWTPGTTLCYSASAKRPPSLQLWAACPQYYTYLQESPASLRVGIPTPPLRGRKQ